MRRNPAACSNALSPRRGTFLSCALDVNGPFSFLNMMRLAAMVEFRPDTYESSCFDAVFTSTPTPLTQDMTVSSRLFLSKFWSTSCWYWPTPIDLGSSLTSSESGSMSLLPMDTAPLTVTSLSGNSSRATSPAE